MSIELTGEYHTDCNLLLERIKVLESQLVNGKHWAVEILEFIDCPEMHWGGNTPDWFVGLASFICDIDNVVQPCILDVLRTEAVDNYLHTVFVQPQTVNPLLLLELQKSFK